jgi:DNA-binding response OmpR family regulator
LLVAKDDDEARVIRGALEACTNPRFVVVHAPNGWEAQRQAADGEYAALLVDDTLTDTDGETLVGRLKAMGQRSPALVLSSAGWVPPAAPVGEDYLPKAEALSGNALARAIVAMLQRQQLTAQLATARDQAAQVTATLNQLTHDLATPLGVVMGMSQVLLSEDTGLNADDRLCLEDVAREALRATEILKRARSQEPGSASAAQPAPRAADPIPAASPAFGRKVVLIADDDPATRRLVSAILASDQYTVIEAADGEEAWRLIREHHPTIAILDWQMPVYSGLELTDVIKGDPQMRGMTVIMLTGRSAQADREAGARAHADLYLTKPVSPDELLAAVRQALHFTI